MMYLFMIYMIFWHIGTIVGTGYAVFVLGHSGWWWLLAVFLLLIGPTWSYDKK